MHHKFLLIVSWLIRTCCYFLPDSKLFNVLRGKLYSPFLIHAGANFQVSSDVRLINLENISVGDNVYLAPGVIINAVGTIDIGDRVLVGFKSTLVSGNHLFDKENKRWLGSTPGFIKIGSGCWVGANCVVLDGADLPSASVFGAGSVANKRYYQSGVYAGAPANLRKPF